METQEESRSSSGFERVSADNPCPVCDGDSWCSRTSDGLHVVCMREKEGALKATKNGGYLHEIKADATTRDEVYRTLFGNLQLIEKHRANLELRGLTPEEIETLGYKSLPQKRDEIIPEMIAQFGAEILLTVPGFYKDEEGNIKLSGSPGLIVPCRDVDGKIIGAQIRVDRSNGKKYRWLSATKKQRKHGGGVGSGSPLHVIGRKYESDKVWITEGLLKADIASLRLKKPFVAVAGVGNWTPEAITQILDALGSPKVVLAFDADAKTNPAVERLLNQLAYTVQSLGYDVRIAQWNAEDGKGIDDLLVAGHTPELCNFELTDLDLLETDDIRPKVIVNNRQMRLVVADMRRAIQAYDGEPLIFQREGRLVRPKFKGQRATLESLTSDILVLELNEFADFFREQQGDDGIILTPATPPKYLSQAILYARRHDVPELDFISASPLFAPDGSIVAKQGYDSNTQVYFHLSDDVQITTADIDPTPENIAKAKALIQNMIEEFPFVDDASKHNAISLMLLPYLRLIIDAEIPLYVIDSSDPGTGKGLLVDTALMPYLNHRPISNTEVVGDEWRKQLTTLLEHSPDYVYFDNANKVDSGALASALTKGYWQDRRLGSNELSTSEIRAIFIVNGNNLEISGENARRVVWVRLIPKTENPEDRRFRIEDLREWVSDHRRELVIAVLTLINNWIEGGMKRGELRMGSFERWARILGGVMEANGYDCFMANVPELKSRVDVSREAIREFVTAWYCEHGNKKVKTPDLFLLASIEREKDEVGDWQEVGKGLLAELLTSANKRGRQTQLGNILQKHTDRTFRIKVENADDIQCQIEYVGQISGYRNYRLTRLSPPSEPPSRSTHTSTNDESSDSQGSSEPREPCEPFPSQREEKIESTNADQGATSIVEPLASDTSPIRSNRFTDNATNLDDNSVLDVVDVAVNLDSRKQGSPDTIEYTLIDNPADLPLAIEPFKTATVIGIDSETTGLDPHTDLIRTIQLAAGGLPVLILDMFKFTESDSLNSLEELFGGDSIKVLHNAKFDLKFLQTTGLQINGQIFDTMLAAQLLKAGLDKQKFSLQALAEEYLNKSISKDEQQSDWEGELTADQLTYAANDAMILLPLRSILKKGLLKAKLKEVATLEFDCVKVVAEMELAGMRLDVEKWEVYGQMISDRLESCRQTLREYFGDETNLNSTQQLQKSLAGLGIEVTSTARNILTKHIGKHPVIDALVEYKKLSKLKSFIEALPKQINPVTNRIHPSYWQLGSKAGRFSCSKPNLQQVPRSLEVRECFKPDAGNTLVIADYSQIELRVAAEISGDSKMIEAYKAGEDLHTLTASLVKGIGVEAVTDNERQAAKAVNFGLIYGMGANGLMNYAKNSYGVEMSLAEAQTFRTRFFEAYTGIKQWHGNVRRNVKETRTLGDRRRIWEDSPRITELYNTPVQGTAADIIKKALTLLPEALAETESRIIGCVHDEILLETLEDHAEQVATILTETMEQAGRYYLKQVPVVAEARIATSWADK